MIKINLLPVRAAQKKESIRQQISVLMLVLVAVFSGIAYVHISINNEINDVEERITMVNAEIESLKRKTGEVDDFKKKKRELLEKLNIIDTLSKNKTGPVLILDMFSQMIPEKMWLEKLKQVGNKVDIEGVALDNETIAIFFTSLKNSPRFARVELIQTKQYEFNAYKLTSFKLSCIIDLSSIKGQ